MRENHKIDATGQAPGRLATSIATLLQGKNKPSYEPNWDLGDFVCVSNVSKMKIDERKLVQKVYYHSSMFLGGLKEIPMRRLMAEKPDRVLFLAVYRMLPKNKLRDKMIKRLVINA